MSPTASRRSSAPAKRVWASAEVFVQQQWNQFCREFVTDVRGEGYAGYPTFQDGWVAAEVIDIACDGRIGTPAPERPTYVAGQS